MARIEREWQAEHEGSALASELHRIMVISHRQAKGFIDCNCVTVNGEIVQKHGHRLKAGDSVRVEFDPEQTYEVLPPERKLKAGPFETLWEDNHLLFVFKPAGLLTVPAEQGGEPSLAEAITEAYRRRGFKRFNLYIVHRLDRFTSGVLVFAKTPEALHGLKKHFELHRLQRVYFAVLVGELPENSGTLAGHLIEHAKSLKMSVAVARKGPGGGKRMPPGAKEAVTHYRVIERLPGHTVVEVKLETGRRNQIRVQFADRGFPLLGDQVYGVESPLLDRQALHAELLGFKHPVTEEQVTVTAPMPADMEAALKVLRNQARLVRASTGVKGEEGIFQPTESFDHKLKRVARAKRYEDRDEAPNRPARPRPGGSEERPRRTFGATDRPSRPPRREDGDTRPRHTSGPSDRPARPRREDGDARPRPASGPSERPARPRREDGDERPRRSFGSAERPARPRREDGDARPRSTSGPSERSARPRREDGDERPRRSFGSAERPARPRREDGDARPRSTSGPNDRPARPRRDDGDERPRRSFGSAERPARPRREDGEVRRPRPASGPADRPARPRRDEGDERPRRTFGAGDRPTRPRSASGPHDRPSGPRREGATGRPSGKPAPRTNKPKPRKP
ncbi:MAG: RluA family pseudouridine synthase [Geothrix sp.]|uniref:RluA family pseudouridine synthase n=1 Tax=Geothrix sp. TaxID=1962974 RepID=UPI00181E4415|nr:RluA family pseudouridine synthase [Geothrix sp.]NWJ41739.1 RluA family pseudouridine synthase [Geothrix sp.]WIL20282.1 MAG: RluA family pseudouridine synthase [Geothrix sp.]